jgi:tetrapyrrole methylase family protein/MazG family protein
MPIIASGPCSYPIPKAPMANKIRTNQKRETKRTVGAAFTRLVKIMSKLRAPGGCPWDRKQTHKSLIPYLVEETYELKDALLARKPERMREEMGDLLLQIVFHAQLASERGRFDAADVADGIADKLIRRHPHVFGPNRRKLTSSQVLGNWERIKLAEKSDSTASVLEGLTKSMPALLRAYRVQEKVAQYGFDWQRAEDVEAKLREDVDEFHAALKQRNGQAVAEELGDLLFTLVNLARHLKVDPETALNATSEKFARRFTMVEKNLKRRGIDPAKAGLDQLEEEWQAVKRELAERKRTNRPRESR